MDSKALLRLDLINILGKAERLLKFKLPSKVMEVSLLPEEKILYVRFTGAEVGEVGEPTHPLIHVFRDKEGKSNGFRDCGFR